MAPVVRRGTLADAESIAAVLNGVIAEGNLTIFDTPFSADDERRFLASLSPRSAVLVADMDGQVIGVQVVDLFSAASQSMRHVATVGTWIAHASRARGIGRLLFERSVAFARLNGYQKIVIQVLATNDRALRFYRRLGFSDIGTARRHVELAGVFHDEIYLELLLD